MTEHGTPELHDRLHEDAVANREDERRRKADALRWLEEHTGFRPFGGEW